MAAIYNNANEFLVSATGDGLPEELGKKSASRKEEEVLKAVYEKRINQGTI